MKKIRLLPKKTPQGLEAIKIMQDALCNINKCSFSTHSEIIPCEQCILNTDYPEKFLQHLAHLKLTS